ncbi:MAG: GNAT family protein [Paracoccaceae bacterium]|nr:GNAT family protein [Paracoccaceae bacterium]
MPPVLASDNNDLILRPTKYGDGAAFVALGWSADIHRMFGGSRTTPPDDRRQVAAGWIKSIRADPFAWEIEHQGRLIGQIRLHSINETDQRARLSVGILTEDQLGQGIGRRVIGMILTHAFGEMSLHRVGLRVLDFNTRAIRCYQSCGFVEEGRERQSACINGEFYDDVMVGVLAHEFQPT